LTAFSSDEKTTEAPANLRSHAVHSAKWIFVQNVSARLLSLVTFSILARLVAPDQFGLLGLAVVVTGLLGLFIDTGVSEAVIQRPALDRAVLDSAFWLSVAAGAVLTLICFLVAEPAARLYDQPELAPVLRVLSVTLLLQALVATQSALLRREFRFRAAAARVIIASVVGSVVAVVWAVISPTVWVLVAQSVATSVAGVAVLWSVSRWRPGFSGSLKLARGLLNFGVNVLGVRLAFFAAEYGDNFTIGLLLGTQQLGYYVVGFRIFRIITEVVTATLAGVTLPVFSRMQHDHGRLVEAYLSVTRLSATIAVPVFAGGAMLAPYIIPVAFGDKWGPSIQVMQILSLVGLVLCVVSFDRSALIAVGRVRLEMVVATCGSVASVASFVIGAQWGITGVAIAITVRMYLFWPVRMLVLRRVIGMPLGKYFQQWLAAVGCGVCMVLAMLGIGGLFSGVPAFIGEAVVGTLVYFVALRVVAPRSFSELIATIGHALPSRRSTRFNVAQGSAP
jgi:PST family polysaccharide transporter